MLGTRFTLAAVIGAGVILFHAGAHAQSPMSALQNLLSDPQHSVTTPTAPSQTTTVSLPNWDVMGLHLGMTADEAHSLILKQWPQAIFGEHSLTLAKSTAGVLETPPQIQVRPSATVQTEALGYEVGYDRRLIGFVHAKGFFPPTAAPMATDIESAFNAEYASSLNVPINDTQGFAVNTKAGTISQSTNNADRSCGQMGQDGFSEFDQNSQKVRINPQFTGNGSNKGNCALFVGFLARTYHGGSRPEAVAGRLASYQVILYSPLLINKALSDRDAAQAEFQKKALSSPEGHTKF